MKANPCATDGKLTCSVAAQTERRPRKVVADGAWDYAHRDAQGGVVRTLVLELDQRVVRLNFAL